MKKSVLYSDGARATVQIAVKLQCKHAYVDHSKGEFVRGEVHTNTIDGCWGRLKTWWNAGGGIQDDHIWTNLKQFIGVLISVALILGPLCCRTFVHTYMHTNIRPPETLRGPVLGARFPCSFTLGMRDPGWRSFPSIKQAKSEEKKRANLRSLHSLKEAVEGEAARGDRSLR